MYQEIMEKFAKRQYEEFQSKANQFGDRHIPKMPQRTSVFGTYRDFLTKDKKSLTIPIIQGIYENTIMFRVIEKIVGDVISGGYKIETGNDDANKLCEKANRLWSIQHKKNSVRDFFLYGNSYDFLGWSLDNSNLISIEEMKLEYTIPSLDANYDIEYYNYIDYSHEYQPDEILHTSYARQKGEIFGIPLLLPAAATLQLLLNSNQNVAILIDRFAVPIVHWMLDTGAQEPTGNKVITTPEEIQEFLQELIKQKSGDDIVTDAGVRTNVLGINSAVWSFDRAIQFMNEQFHAIVGVPAALIGYGGSNKEITTRQLQIYYDTIDEVQQDWGSQVVEQKYRPLCENNGYMDLDYDIQFPKKEIEERSQKAQWAIPLYQVGGMTLGELREQFRLAHDKPKETQDVQIPAAVVKNQLSQQYTRNSSNPQGTGKQSGGIDSIGGGTTSRQTM